MPQLKGDLLSICLVSKTFRQLALPLLYQNLILEYDKTEGLDPVLVRSLLQAGHPGLPYIQHLSVRPGRRQVGRLAWDEASIWKTKKLDLAIINDLLFRLEPGQLRSFQYVMDRIYIYTVRAFD